MDTLSDRDQQAMQEANIKRIAIISQQIREAVRKALPAPPDQFFHVMVPGKVVNFEVSSFYISWIYYHVLNPNQSRTTREGLMPMARQRT